MIQTCYLLSKISADWMLTFDFYFNVYIFDQSLLCSCTEQIKYCKLEASLSLCVPQKVHCNCSVDWLLLLLLAAELVFNCTKLVYRKKTYWRIGAAFVTVLVSVGNHIQ